MENEQTMKKQVEFAHSSDRNQAASNFCKRQFPTWFGSIDPDKQRVQGELQRIFTKAWEKKIFNEEKITEVGNWWLWARNLMIENTFTKQQKEKMLEIAINTINGKPINFITARSPELLHAQVPNQGDTNLPRSKKAVETLAKIVQQSNTFLPTQATLIFADLAIDNLSEIKKHCDMELTIQENLKQLQIIAKQTGMNNLEILRMSQLPWQKGSLLGDIIDSSGKLAIEINIDKRAINTISTASRESLSSHQQMFGWNERQSVEHNLKLALTMGVVGLSIKQFIPSAIMIHNEAFISRGALNNILNNPNDPLPVICLRDLLESKRVKE